jgi:cyclic pyranopterin phosphate synthase
MPKQAFGRFFQFIPHDEMLSFEEISRLAAIFVRLGVEKIRLTGGEPLLRRHIETLIVQLRELKTPDGRDIDLTMTTNGSLLSGRASALYRAGLRRITISLDALDDDIFRRMNDMNFPVTAVLNGIASARAAGFSPVKVNMVVKKGSNDSEILPIARLFKGTPVIPRFIEYMDVGTLNQWKLDEVLPSDALVQMIDREMPLEERESNYAGETASRWCYKDGQGEIGVIASVTRAFCKGCTRARLSTTGILYPCLFATEGFDLKTPIREKRSDEEIAESIVAYWRGREDRYSELRHTRTFPGNKIEMSYIGG